MALKSLKLVLMSGFMMMSMEAVVAHPGGVDKNGGHKDSKSGQYHCHRSTCSDNGTSMKVRSPIDPRDMGTSKILHADYDRKEWMTRWSDFDGDCQDTRHEMLAETSMNNVTYKTNRQCRVVAGKWVDPYSMDMFFNAKKLDIDHIIPLAYAHRNGASVWSKSKKAQFAEDPLNLLVVSAKHNRSKSDKGPSKYMPPENQCLYIDRWNKVSTKYGLIINPKDMKVLKETYASKCLR